MKVFVNVIAVITLTLVFLSPATAQDVKTTKLAKNVAEKMLKTSEASVMEADIRKLGYTTPGIVQSEVYTGKDDLGEYQIQITYQDFKSKSAKLPVTLTRVQTFRKGVSQAVKVFAEDGANVSRVYKAGSATARGTSCLELICVNQAITTGSKCINCSKTVENCIKSNKKTLTKIGCIIKNSTGLCISCVVNMIALTSCIINCD